MSATVGMTEGGVIDHDVLFGNPVLLEIGLEDLVRRARIDVVGAGDELVFQVVHRRDGLLIRRRAGVEDVARGLLALVLHRIEQQPIQLLEHRQHGLARHRGPAAEHRGHLLLFQQLARLFGEQRPVRRRVHHHGFELLAEQTALLVLLLDQHQHGVLQRRLADGHGAGQGMQHADLDGVLAGRRRLFLGRQVAGAKAKGQCPGQGECLQQRCDGCCLPHRFDAPSRLIRRRRHGHAAIGPEAKQRPSQAGKLLKRKGSIRR